MLICHYRGYLGQVSIGNLLPLFVFSTAHCMLIKRSLHANFYSSALDYGGYDLCQWSRKVAV